MGRSLVLNGNKLYSRHRQSRFLSLISVLGTILWISSIHNDDVHKRIGVVAGSSSTIPRSNPRQLSSVSSSSSSSEDNNNMPPWNPSEQIDKEGFLKQEYRRVPGKWEQEANIGGKYSPRNKNYESTFAVPITVRQVPGDGNCLFHSLSTCLTHAINGTHRHMSSHQDLKDLQAHSSMLRKLSVRTLETTHKKLFLQGKEYLLARDLVDAAAAQYDMTGEQYCQLMKRDCYWGGGPEIVALCNVLQRPIHVYELVLSSPTTTTTATTIQSNTNNQTNTQFCLRRMACFGSPKFDSNGEPLCILSADSRFPDIAPGRQLASGNHFLALFPQQQKNDEEENDDDTLQNKKQRKKHAGGFRGGGDLQERKKNRSNKWRRINILRHKDIQLTNFVIIMEFLVVKLFQILSTTKAEDDNESQL